MEKKITKHLQEMAQKDIEEVFLDLNSTEEGLDQAQSDQKLKDFGLNEVTYEKRKPWYIYLLRSFLDPFILILLFIIFITYFTDIAFAHPADKSYTTIVIISVLIAISVLLRFTQEYKSQITADNLKELVPTTTAIKRKGKKPEEINMKYVVPGDVIYLAAGDLIPADMRIITATDLFISQSSLTGESEPVEKFTYDKNSGSNENVADLDNIALMGTIVVSGSARGVVLRTGNNSYFGSIAKSISKDVGETSFEEGVKSVSVLLMKFMFVMVPIVFLINGLTKGDWLSALIFAISIAVGLTPEMLPTIVSTNLAKGANSLSKKKIVVKRLNSIQNFGAMDILCTDKTGTLTEDKIILEAYLNITGNEDENVLLHGYLNSFHQTGLKNLLDLAVIKRGDETGIQDQVKMYTKIDEIPFDFKRRRMSVVVIDDQGTRSLISKGAIEEMLSISDKVQIEGEIIPLTAEKRQEILDMVYGFNAEGMRVLGVSKKINVPDETKFGIKDESEMTLIGFMCFLDPAKESAVSAIKALYKNGLDVKILTGDNDIVSRKIARDVGIPINNVILGADIADLTDEELYQEAIKSSIIAKLSPIQKERVIRVLQEHEHVVGFLGDGINDAPGLKQADVGISVNTAVDIAKESADILLLEKDLNVLEKGIIEGRRVFGNINKYIKITASSNFGNIFSVLIASAFLPFLPMLPIQLLVQNLAYSISQISVPWDNMDEEYLEKPQQWDAGSISKFMIYIGPVSSIFDIATFAIMWFVFGANSVANMALFQSGWFVVGLLTQTLIVHFIRTRKIPFIQSRASAPVLLMTAAVMALGVAIPFTSFGAYLGFVPLPPKYFLWLVGILVSYSILTELVKRLYVKKFDSWI